VVRVVLFLLYATALQLVEGWQLAVSDARTTPPGEEVQWQRDAEPRGRDLWFRNTLPANTPDDARLAFRAYVGELTVFVEQQPIYSFRDIEARGRITFHAISLPRRSAGKRVYVRIPNAASDPFVSRPHIAAAGALPHALYAVTIVDLRDDLADVVIGAVLAIIGLITLGVSLLRRRASAQALPWFGAFAAMYGARLIVDSYLPLLLRAQTTRVDFTEAWITYLINIPGWALAWRLIGDGWKRTMRWQVMAFALFAPIAIVSDIVTGNAGSLEEANNVLVIIGGINILLNLLHGRRWQTAELRIVLAGTLVFMLFAIANNLGSLGVLPWRETDETLGFLVFVAALGFAATRNFVRDQRERAAIESELATAREIQQSILPTSMPDVAGLRFHAHYDPASSVAGDLYDFLRSENGGVSVLVADVSGHGVPAALIASMVKIAVSSHARLAHDPATLMREVNRTLRGQVRRVFVTATMLSFDGNRGVEVVNAGHPPPLLLRGGAIRELGTSNVVLGRFDAPFTSQTTELQRGDRIVAYTDGVTEARNGRGEEFGEERLHALLRGGASADAIAQSVRAWRGDRGEVDDVTIVSVDVV
jgi:phosphoserine phosphatase RsbU/P